MVVTSKGLKIAHLNVRSLLKHKDEIFLSLGGIDMLGFSETWLTGNVIDNLLVVKNYVHFRQDRRTTVHTMINTRVKRGGGLILYIKDRFAPHTSMLHGLSESNVDIEML